MPFVAMLKFENVAEIPIEVSLFNFRIGRGLVCKKVIGIVKMYGMINAKHFFTSRIFKEIPVGKWEK